MDRATIFTQEQGRSVDFLFAQRATMIAIGKLAQAALGSNTVVRGLAVTPNSPAALNVLVGIGEIYTVAVVDATSWGSLDADADTIVQQGLNMAAQTISTPAPSTSGYSIAYLIEAQFQSQDTTPVVLPFFNSANPSIPLNGQGDSGATLPTERQGVCVIQAKAGVAATTGTQVTPTVDSGWTALAVVTVANGQSTVTSGNISIPAGVPQVSSLLQMMQTGSTIYAIDTSTSANAVALSLTPAVTAYTDGAPIRFKAANSNTGPCTINWGGGSIALNGANGALQGAEIIAGKQYEAQYNSTTGTAILLGQTAGALQIAPATASQHAVQLGQAQALVGAYSAVQPFSSNSSVTSAVIGEIVEWTGAVGTLTLAAVSTFGAAGEKVRISNLGTGMLTVAAASGDSIQFGPSSITSMTVPPGLDLELTVNGAANRWDATGGSCLPSGVLIKVTAYDFTGPVSIDPRTKAALGKMVGGAGAGGGAPATGSGQVAVGAGGASAGWLEFYIPAPADGLTFTNGSGGAGTTSTGGAGGASTYNGLTAVSGNGGVSSGAFTFGGAGVAAATTPATSQSGAGSGVFAAGSGQFGAQGIAYSIQSFSGGAGGSSIFGGGGGTSNGSGGTAGLAAGAGGSGASIGQSASAQSGGAGFKGKLIVWEFM